MFLLPLSLRRNTLQNPSLRGCACAVAQPSSPVSSRSSDHGADRDQEVCYGTYIEHYIPDPEIQTNVYRTPTNTPPASPRSEYDEEEYDEEQCEDGPDQEDEDYSDVE